ncbi:helix-turn-helix domain-containing protein [Frigidibacter sp.]|uniref:helix-turn-helix domain-containing protein n=1 Tax=Frigidibacter sp. TaxID=2586418 RepID=UPI002734AD36|nr:XRE family transcriptional regulator [Frigidibacter sp.]MDP3342168.1 XRE family transcriptional regulator [Frigidibacter sp.]
MSDTIPRNAGPHPVEDDHAPYASRVGQRIRWYRELRGLSLSELSRRAGVAKGTLSALEGGQGNPTIMTLVALGRVLDLTPSDFLSPGGRSDDPGPTTAALSGPYVVMRFLSRREGDAVWEVFEATLPQGDAPFHSETHDGIEHIFLLEGEALIGPSGSPSLLTKGESLRFPGNEPHLYHSPGGETRMLLIMEYPKGAGPVH